MRTTQANRSSLGVSNLEVSGVDDSLSITLDNWSAVSAVDGQSPWFLAGTRIATIRGEVPVERLMEGDIVRTRSGPKSLTRVARRTYAASRVTRDPAVHPVRVCAGALADGVPCRDLLVSPRHGLMIDGVLIPAGALVNDVSILRRGASVALDYYEVELDAHDVLLANGAPAETFIHRTDIAPVRDANRSVVSRAAPKESGLTRIEGGRRVALIREKLLARALAGQGFLTPDPSVHLLVDGMLLAPTRLDESIHEFELPSAPSSIRVRSRSGIPAALGLGDDRRRLGIAVRAILIRSANFAACLDPNGLPAGTGFHQPAPRLRWTNGDAELSCAPLVGLRGPITLTIVASALASYPIASEPDAAPMTTASAISRKAPAGPLAVLH